MGSLYFLQEVYQNRCGTLNAARSDAVAFRSRFAKLSNTEMGETMFTIREMTIDDYEAVIALWEAAELPYRLNGRDRRDKIARELEGPSSIFLVAEVDGQIVGAVLGTHDGRKGWINRLVVATERQRKGIGETLVSEVETRLDAIGIEIVACQVEDWNSESMTFFERIGYRHHDDIHYFSKRKHAGV
jgi:ribosomal protein S18 acetylase RimI-like enzyme